MGTAMIRNWVSTIQRGVFMACMAVAALFASGTNRAESQSFGSEFKLPYPDPIISGSVFFGVSVAASGDTAVVGAMYAQGVNGTPGAAYVFVRDGDVWVQQAKLFDADLVGNAFFGHTVAISGDTLIVGAPSGPTQNGPGVAYVYVRSNGTWSLQQRILAADGNPVEQFGYAVAISGDTVLIGTPSDTPGTPYGQGSVYVYTRSGVTWSLQTKLVEPVPAVANYFGTAVALHNDTAVIGVSAANSYRGAAYVFARDNGTWTQQARLTAADGEANDMFGGAVAVHGDTAVVGAFIDRVDGQQWHGSAHVFQRQAGVWSPQAQLFLNDAGATPQFGLGVAIEGDNLLIGARHGDATTTRQGVVVHYVRESGGWSRKQTLHASEGTADDVFGHALAISGDNIVVGAYTDEPAGMPGSTDSGSVYFFRQSAPTADLQISIDNGVAQLLPQQPVSYEVLVANAGPAAVQGASFVATVPAGLTQVTWTCAVASGIATCPAPGGNGAPSAQTLDLPANSALRYEINATVAASAGAFISHSATITAPVGVADSDPASNSAIDTDPVVPIGLFANGFEQGQTARLQL